MPRFKSRRKKVNYESDQFQPCWTCKNACGGCSWSKDFTPIPGWKAEKTYHRSNGNYAESYKIASCPQYIRG